MDMSNYPVRWNVSQGKSGAHHRLGFTLILVVLCAVGCSTTSGSPVVSLPGKSNQYDIFSASRQAAQAYEESRFIEAVQLYQNIVERVPNDADAWFRLGNTYVQQGTYDRAIHAYERSLSNESDQPKAWFNLSTAYLLYAQNAMRNAHDKMRVQDPARIVIQRRLEGLQSLVHGRIEGSVSATSLR